MVFLSHSIAGLVSGIALKPHASSSHVVETTVSARINPPEVLRLSVDGDAVIPFSRIS
jgi:hypothetical protein